MRVALMPSAYAPAVGGVEELTRRLADRLKGIGDTVEVWTFRHPPGLPMDEVIEGIRVRRFAFPLPA
ncbi:MAG: glycosyltransferase family 1 protein, partial [Actinobacteria bacterium]|nr:glycosyltransferase family 1 protein [Actinomycetota bacterium]